MESGTPMLIGSLCTGIGGLDDAVAQAFNARPLWLSEIDPYASKVLDARIPAINLGDLTQITDPPRVQIITAGFPCQDISLAGPGDGLEGERSALWFEVLRVIETVSPQYVVIENVAALAIRGLDVVLAGLTAAGYGGSWCYYRSGYYSRNPSEFAHIGGCHQRKRLFILATRGGPGFTQSTPGAPASLGGQVSETLPTPTASMATGAGRSGRDGGANLQTAIADLLPTPASRGGSNRGGAAGRVGPVRYSLDSIDKLLPPPTVWGKYAPAVERWATLFGTPPPPPSTQGRLNPALPEWMMGYPAGWVTDLDIPKTQQLKVIGNAVQPQTALAAINHLLENDTQASPLATLPLTY